MNCLHPLKLPHPYYVRLKSRFQKGEISLDEYLISRKKLGALPENIIPCGKCCNCQKRKRDEWVFRLFQEYFNVRHSFFVTLTYDDPYLWFNPSGVPSVCKKHVQYFFKRLRHKLDFRYFLISEYGPENGRPHYHFILFTDDPRYDCCDLNGIIEKCWSNGFVTTSDVNGNRIGYVSSYCMKDVAFRPMLADPNFMLSSRKPAIGISYITQAMQDYHNADLSRCWQWLEDRKYPLPRLLRDKIFDDDSKALMLEKHIIDAKTHHDENVSKFRSERDYYKYLEGLEAIELKKLLSKRKSKKL